MGYSKAFAWQQQSSDHNCSTFSSKQTNLKASIQGRMAKQNLFNTRLRGSDLQITFYGKKAIYLFIDFFWEQLKLELMEFNRSAFNVNEQNP